MSKRQNGPRQLVTDVKQEMHGGTVPPATGGVVATA